jgi:asparagine synthase (glutamine-hydrolysing)
MLAGVRKLGAGSIATISVDSPGAVHERVYWSLEGVARREAASRKPIEDDAVLEEFLPLLSDAVRLRMYADVPLGALLSGGIDSSLVTAVMQSLSSRPVNTFCIGFDDQAHDERRFATRVAELLGTRHHELQVTGADALALVERLPTLVDEPLADPSVIPTYLVSALARRHVTVVLTGDGGDELFAGYNRQAFALRIHALERLPRIVRRGLSLAVGTTGMIAGPLDRLWGLLSRSRSRPRITTARLAKLGHVLRARDLAQSYQALLSAWTDPESVLRHVVEAEHDPIVAAVGGLQGGEPLDQVLLADQASYLPDDLLAKLDRTSMAASLEARAPLLDHRIVEYSWSLGPQFKLRSGESKWLLRQALSRFLPKELFDRPKTGFTVPLGEWMRGPLRSWAGDHLRDAGGGSESVFRPSALGDAWTALQKGRDSMALPIWTIVQFQAWRRHWGV